MKTKTIDKPPKLNSLVTGTFARTSDDTRNLVAAKRRLGRIAMDRKTASVLVWLVMVVCGSCFLGSASLRAGPTNEVMPDPIPSVNREHYEEVSLNGDWDFTFKEGFIADIPAELPFAKSYDVKVRVPDYLGFQTERLSQAKSQGKKKEDVSSAPVFVKLSGTGFYRKTVDIPADWAGRSVQLYVGRAQERINVWVNGKHMAYCPYIGFVPASIDLSNTLKPGQPNELIISVDNTAGFGPESYYGPSITSPVYLKASKGCGRIDDIHIRAGQDLKEAIWQVDLKIPFKDKSAGLSRIDWLVKKCGSQEVFGEGSVKVDGFSGDKTVEWVSRHEVIEPWHPANPNLYTAELSWQEGDKVIDTRKQRFGLRKWSSEGRNLKLNGKPIYLRQYIFCDMPHYRYPTDKEGWRQFYQLEKELGFNSIVIFPRRVSVSQEALEAADEIGIVVQSGVGRKDKVATFFNKKVEQLFDLWGQIAEWNKNYPSMSIYCLGVENDYYEGFIDDVRKVNDIIKSIHPESMLMPNQAMRGFEYSFLPKDKDQLALTPFPHHAGRLEEITKCSDIFGNYPRSAFSYDPFKSVPQAINEELSIYKRPLISHEVVMCWTMPNFYPADGLFPSLRYGKRSREYMCCYWWWGGVRSKAEIEKGIAQANTRSRSWYESASRLNTLMAKYIFEKLRKCDNIAGYEALFGKGIDELSLEPLPGNSFEKYRRFNNDNVLLLDFDGGKCLNRCYWAGDKFQGKAIVSLYGEKPVKQGMLTLEIKHRDKPLFQMSFKAGDIPLGKVTTLKDMEFIWPDVAENCKLNLSLRLTGSGEDICNDWDFWIFKKYSLKEIRAACTPSAYQLLKERYPDISALKGSSPEKLWIMDNLTGDGLKHLQEGGDVLLVGDAEPFPLMNEWKTFAQGWRNHHNFGSVIYAHPVFRNIPQEGWGDWQFYPLLQGAPTVIFEDRRTPGHGGSNPKKSPKMPLMKNVPFDPILEISHVPELQQAKQASIFELKAGEGRLFVTTCRFPENPVAVTLMDSILSYMSGPEFKPKSAINMETFIELAGCKEKLFLEIEAEDFTRKENVEIVAFPEASKGKAVKMLDEKSLMETAVSLPEGSYSMYVRGYGSASECDGVYVETGGGKERIWFDKWCKRQVPSVKLGKNGDTRIAISYVEPEVVVDKVEIYREVSGEGTSAEEGKIKKVQKISDGKISDREDKKAKDTIRPTFELVSSLTVEQMGGSYSGSKDAVYSIIAKDNLSGVSKIEIAIDSGEYTPCKGGFKLSPGLHTIKCRVTDNAGNQAVTFNTSGWGGGDSDCIMIEIK